MVLELRDKLPVAGKEETPAVPSLTPVEDDVLSALVNLGYQRASAEKVLSSVDRNGPFDSVFRAALAAMSK